MLRCGSVRNIIAVMSKPIGRLVLAGVALLATGLWGVPARERLAGPVEARLLEVIDGDTIRVRARIWLGQEVETLVRLAGVNAPELTAPCPEERTLARAAQQLLARSLGPGELRLTEIQNDKYGGRVIATVRTASGADPGDALLKAGLARAYEGGRRSSWCASGE